jgi:hypothetical protein
MNRYKNYYSILAISKHDLRAPIHGSARLLLSILGTLSYYHNVIYIGATGSYDDIKLLVEFRDNITSFRQITLSRHYRNPFLIHEIISRIIRRINFVPDIIFCATREHIFTCKLLAEEYDAILIMLQDALRYLYINNPLRSLAITWYTFVTLMSDVSICVTRDIEDKLRKIGLGLKKNIYTIRPTFMLLTDINESINVNGLLNKLEKFNMIVHYSGPLELLPLLAIKFPSILFTITGPSAYYAKQYLGDKEWKNIMLLHNIPDSMLKILYNKVLASIIIRPVMTGISMTALQSLYFGVPIIANKTAILGLDDLIDKYNEKNVIKIFNQWSELVKILKGLENKDNYDLGLREMIIRIFNENFSPKIFNAKFNVILNNVIL